MILRLESKMGTVIIFFVLTAFVFSQEIDYEKNQLYESQKKSPLGAFALAYLPYGVGHAYAGNWTRGLLFNLGEAVVFAGILAYYHDPDANSTYMGNMSSLDGIQVAIGAFLVIKIWEMIDAYQLTDKYNENLYKRIYGEKTRIGLSIVPLKVNAEKYALGLNLSLTF